MNITLTPNHGPPLKVKAVTRKVTRNHDMEAQVERVVHLRLPAGYRSRMSNAEIWVALDGVFYIGACHCDHCPCGHRFGGMRSLQKRGRNIRVTVVSSRNV